MDFLEYSHRHGLEIVHGDEKARIVYQDLISCIQNMDERQILQVFLSRRYNGNNDISLSKVINNYFKKELTNRGWKSEVRIFKESEYQSNSDWRLDFAFDKIFSLEVAFNHSSASLVNLMKPVLASEINHVKKQLDGENRTNFGIIITATQELKDRGGFDGAIGTYENYVKQLKPYMNYLVTPTTIIGIKSPKNFLFKKYTSSKPKYFEIVNQESGEIIYDSRDA